MKEVCVIMMGFLKSCHNGFCNMLLVCLLAKFSDFICKLFSSCFTGSSSWNHDVEVNTGLDTESRYTTFRF